MKNVWGIVEGMGVLIVIFLVLSRSKDVDRLIRSSASALVPTVKVFQGRG